MVMLPIVERELRRATRLKSTYRARMTTALLASVVGCLFVVNAMLFGGSSNARAGGALFGTLSFFAFGLALLSGVFLASDSISQEKREGTLGLLFLTDLRGYDVVLGKFAAAGLRAFYCLLASLPVMAFPLFMGGVTGGEYWRVSLSLVNALFFSMALGILVSTLSKNGAGAMRKTFVFLVFGIIAGSSADALISGLHLNPAWHYLAAMSPSVPFANGFAYSFSRNGGSYYTSLLINHLTGWFMLGLSSWLLPRVWQEKGVKERRAAVQQGGVVISRSEMEKAWRKRCLDENPAMWLVSRNGSETLIWLASILAILALIGSLLASYAFNAVSSGEMFGVIVIVQVYGFILKLLLIFEACRFFGEARRDGTLELMMSTPLTGKRIVEGYQKSLLKMFLWPSVVLVLIQFAGIVGSFFLGDSSENNIRINSAGATFAFIGVRLPFVVMAGYGVVKWCCDMIAIAYVGMWLSLSMKKPSLAVPVTLLIVVIIPTILCFVPGLVTSVVLFLWAQNMLTHHFRHTVLPTYLPGRMAGLGPPPAKPPVIS